MHCFKKLPVTYKYAFFSALVFGLVSQGMGLFNKFSWHDDASSLFSVGTTFSSGRWMLGLLEQLDMLVFGGPPTSLPLTNGLLAILMIGISVCCFVSLLQIQNPAVVCLISGSMVSFPGITGLFGFSFTLPYYALAILLASLGANLICRGNRLLSRIAGIPLITLSLGIYQAFFSVALCGILFFLITYGLEEVEKPSLLIRKGLLAALSIILSMLLYFLFTHFFLALFHTKLNNYMGIDQMGQSSILVYLQRIVYAYKVFFSQDTSQKYYMFALTSRRVYLLICVLSIMGSLGLIIRQFRDKAITSILLVFLVGLVPLAMNFVFVMADPNDVHRLMTYGQVFILIYWGWLIDRCDLEFRKISRMLRGGGLALLLLIVTMFCRYDNQCYLKATLTQQEAISYFTTMVTQIKSAQGYKDGLSIYVVNDFQIQDNTLTHYDKLDHVTQDPYGDMAFFLNNYNWKYFVRNWCGFSPVWKDGTEIALLPEVQNMPSYPDDGSILILDDKVIIKF